MTITLKSGQMVHFICREGDFYCVRYLNSKQTTWIHKSFVQRQEQRA